MTKVMIFIDGSWLYSNTGKLAQDYARPDLQIDYGLLPEAISQRVAKAISLPSIDIVRTHLFASIPDNYDQTDYESVRRRLDFFNLLKEEHHYEVELFPIDFRGRRIRSYDRDPADPFEPREKCVDIALAASMLYYAAIPQVYDIAIAVIGDQDYVPVLQHVRRLGKRVAIASIRGSCAQDYADPVDTRRVKDVDLIWLNDMIGEIELRYEPRQLVCQSEFHVGDRLVWTTYRPRRNQPFFCDDCRRIYAERHQEEYRKPEPRNPIVRSAPAEPEYKIDQSSLKTGLIYEIKDDRRFGFIRAHDGLEYFFHLTDLENVTWEEIDIGMEIEFHAVKPPSSDRAGKAASVRVVDLDDDWDDGYEDDDAYDDYDEDERVPAHEYPEE
ncbi:MAG: NYN domain-containing protein [Thermomicrobiales bacterium]